MVMRAHIIGSRFANAVNKKKVIRLSLSEVRCAVFGIDCFIYLKAKESPHRHRWLRHRLRNGHPLLMFFNPPPHPLLRRSGGCSRATARRLEKLLSSPSRVLVHTARRKGGGAQSELFSGGWWCHGQQRVEIPSTSLCTGGSSKTKILARTAGRCDCAAREGLRLLQLCNRRSQVPKNEKPILHRQKAGPPTGALGQVIPTRCWDKSSRQDVPAVSKEAPPAVSF